MRRNTGKSATALKKQLDAKLRKMKTLVDPADQAPALDAGLKDFLIARVEQLDKEYNFDVLRNDCVDIMSYLSGEIAQEPGPLERLRKQSYLLMMKGLYMLFNDLAGHRPPVY